MNCIAFARHVSRRFIGSNRPRLPVKVACWTTRGRHLLVLGAVALGVGSPPRLGAAEPSSPAAPTTAATPAAEQPDGEPVLFDGKSLEGWRIIDKWDFSDHGAVEVQDGAIVLGKGDPATGISWKGDLPRNNYELTWQAQRRSGSDFFCGLTFPVRDSHCTLILGGWGGQIVGLSNIDGFSAVENSTTRTVAFEEKRWYQLRLRVTDAKIQVWLDEKPLVDVDAKGKKFSIWWEQEPVTPLGIVTWNTEGAIKDLRWKTLQDK
jgi:hypothetical protein